MKKIRFFCAFALMLLAGCAVNTPNPSATPQLTPAQQRAAFEAMDWGVLQPLVGASWLDRKTGGYAALSPNRSLGRLELVLVETNQLFSRSVKLNITPSPNPGQFQVHIEKSNNFLADDRGIARFDETGRMHRVSGTLKPEVELVINAEALSFSRPRSHGEPDTKVGPLTMPRDVFTMPDGRKVLVSTEPDSEYQKLREGRPFGMWEHFIEHSYISTRLTVKLSKDEAGRLILTYARPNSIRPGQYVYDVDTTPSGPARPLQVVALPNREHEEIKVLRSYLSPVDRLVTQYEEKKNWFDNGQYGGTTLLRGDFVLVGGYQRRSDQNHSDAHRWTDLYLPVNEERVLAAMREDERVLEAAERAKERRLQEEERSRIASQNRYNATLAFMTGLRSGLAHERATTTARYQEMDRNFERNVNQIVRSAEQDLQRKKAAEIAAKAQAEAKAAQAKASVSAQTSQSRVASASTAQTQAARQAEAAKQAQAAKQAAAAKQAEQARQQAEAERRKQEAEQRKKQEAERAKRQQATALAQHLLVEKQQTRLRALQCPGKDGLPSVTGTRPRVQPRVANCVTVHFEARCPSERPGSGMRGSIWAFQGHNSCADDSNALPRKLACEPAQAIVAVTDVTVCN